MIASLLLLAASLSPAPGPTPDEPAGEDFITDVWAREETCNADNALRVGFSDLASAPGELVGRCVQVSGYLSGRALFIGRADASLRYSQSTDSLAGRRVGLYGLARASPATPSEKGFHRIVGIVGECGRLGGRSVMVMGYCHYTGGPFIAVSQVRRGR